MKAMYFNEFEGELSVVDLPKPELSPNGVVIKVEATGLCRSDWHGWMGHDVDISLPHVPGHELAGVITAVGSEVKKHSVGDRVTVPFVCGCGECEFCLRGDAQVCPTQTQPGFTGFGSFAEYVAIEMEAISFPWISVIEVCSPVFAAPVPSIKLFPLGQGEYSKIQTSSTIELLKRAVLIPESIIATDGGTSATLVGEAFIPQTPIRTLVRTQLIILFI